MTTLNSSDDLPAPISAADHIRGSHAPAITIIEYGDFECPTCKQAANVVLLLIKRFPGRVGCVFRHCPLEEVHANALTAAEASEAAAVQGRFWEMHDKLFDNRSLLQRAHLLQLAEELGLDVGRFLEDLRSHVHVPRIRQHAAESQRLGVRTIPTFYVNGALCDVSFGVAQLVRAVKDALSLEEDGSRARQTAHLDADFRDAEADGGVHQVSSRRDAHF